MTNDRGKSFLFGAVALIVTDPSYAAERPPAAAAGPEPLERVFVGVPNQLTLPPDPASPADSVADRARCDADFGRSKGRRAALEPEGGEETCASDPDSAREPAGKVTDMPKAPGQNGR
jgi:hypothetical protein